MKISRAILVGMVLIACSAGFVVACQSASAPVAPPAPAKAPLAAINGAGAVLPFNQMTVYGIMSGDASIPAALQYQLVPCATGDASVCKASFPLPEFTSGEVDMFVAAQQVGGANGAVAKYACGFTNADGGTSCKVSRACAATEALSAGPSDAGYTVAVTQTGADGGCSAYVSVSTNSKVGVNWKLGSQILAVP
jgi:hypothetical protein